MSYVLSSIKIIVAVEVQLIVIASLTIHPSLARIVAVSLNRAIRLRKRPWPLAITKAACAAINIHVNARAKTGSLSLLLIERRDFLT